MSDNKVILRVERSAATRTMRIYISDRDNTFYAEPVTLTQMVPGAVIPIAASVAEDDVQALVDDLWRAGYRPSEYGGEGQVEAMKDHIGDLRTTTDRLFGLVEGEAAARAAPKPEGGG